MGIHVEQLHDPPEFAAVAEPLLMRNEAENCFWLGMISNPAKYSSICARVRARAGVGVFR